VSARAHDCVWNVWTCAEAARGRGHLELLLGSGRASTAARGMSGLESCRWGRALGVVEMGAWERLLVGCALLRKLR